ncbi:FAD:protein FMN transferase [Sphaerisporangium rufum]|uniref:FAD:protein FMN transferase n=1 Tax=Sphaerisporangium rufum TaxID=1381558 RepID=A0A919V1I0_9ACTN|nr:FAD:protein FMN transferase [Sphaerisporangium rufum]GII78627.1 FAD:protein FMN transferase [Sphaerisporangium rufum]
MIRHAEHVMGTVFSFDVRHQSTSALRAALAGAVGWLHRVDEVFSTYRPGSHVSRLGRGEIDLADCPAEVGEVLDLCAAASAASGGCFTATPGGRLDPSGLVKGWAVERASAMLRAAGATCHAVNGGGDVRLSGEAAPGRPWRTGIADPLRPGGLAAVVSGRDLAVATSGVAERGAHVLDPRSGRPASELASVTVVAADLAWADALATAALAMGDQAREWLAGLPGVAAFAVLPSGGRWWTPDFPRYAPEVAGRSCAIP